MHLVHKVKRQTVFFYGKVRKRRTKGLLSFGVYSISQIAWLTANFSFLLGTIDLVSVTVIKSLKKSVGWEAITIAISQVSGASCEKQTYLNGESH